MKPRPYQTAAVTRTFDHWNAGVRSVLIVAPTGAGKTFIIVEVIERLRQTRRRVLIVVHRLTLVQQVAEKLSAKFKALDVGIIAPGFGYSPHAPIQVGTVQTLIARDALPDVEVIIFDEAHHFLADEWGKLHVHYKDARTLGVTATPERTDGRPLGDAFDELVVTTSYSQLIRDGHLVNCRVMRPPESLGSELALHPLAAYQKHGENGLAFLFCGSVKVAKEMAEEFTAAGIKAECIVAKTPTAERNAILDRFKAGETRVLTNVNTLTEGVDVPQARVAIFASGCSHVTPFLQKVGRVLRPYPGKLYAILLDLVGATLKHGLPTEDRVYSLEGKGIVRAKPEPLRNCMKCGRTLIAAVRKCPACGFMAEIQPRDMPKIHDIELQAVWDGANTPQDAKDHELQRLRDYAEGAGFSFSWIMKEYKRVFSEIAEVGVKEKHSEFDRLRAEGVARGYKPGYVGMRYKEMFGAFPPRAWQ